MNGPEKSDSAILATKLANKAQPSEAEQRIVANDMRFVLRHR